MKKFLFLILSSILIFSASLKAQCPPNATAFAINYSTCIPTPGCAVLLNGWPEGVLVNIFGGTPLQTINTVQIPGTYPGPGVDNAFVCVPCNTPLVFASTVPGAINGCVIISTITTPLKLNNFTVNESGNGANKINWSTSSENGTEKFIVERSINSKEFIELATIKAQGTDGTDKTYSYLDKITGLSKMYYRLKTIDISGKVSYSEIISIYKQPNIGISIYPNPVSDIFKINLSAQQLPALVKIYNAQGKPIFTKRISEETLTVNEKLQSGIYVVKVLSDDNKFSTEKFIVK